MKHIIFFFLLSLLCLSHAQEIPDLWQNIRNSSYNQDGNIHIRFESAEIDVVQHTVAYRIEGLWQYLSAEGDFPTYEVIAQGSPEHNLDLFFKSDIDMMSFFMPGFFYEDVTISTEGQMLKVADYPPQGLEEPFLEILADYVCYSDNKFYTGIKNMGGGFPISASLIGPFYAYTAGFVLPTADIENPVIAYMLVYTVDLGPIISSGLYKIGIEDFELERLGDIQSTIISDENLLIMSCDIADLMTDPSFADWSESDLSDYLAFTTMTLKISNFGADIDLMGMGATALMNLDYYQIEPFENVLPELSDASYNLIYEGVPSTEFSVTYYDENNHFPLVSDLVIDGSYVYELTGYPLDFTGPVTYFTVVDGVDWNEAVFVFSDNGYEFVEYKLKNETSTVPQVDIESYIRVFPNPFSLSSTRNGGNIRVEYSVPERQFVKIQMYNLRGQRVAELFSGEHDPGIKNLYWSIDQAKRDLSTGIYFIRVELENYQTTGVMTILK